MAVIWKLLAAIALILMPLGMEAGAAAQAQAPHMTAAAGHCDDTGNHLQGKASHCCYCAAACSASLPAECADDAHEPAAAVLAAVVPFTELADQDPDTATPPPKPS